MTQDNDRDLAHEADMRALRREQLEADCGGEMADPYPEDDDPYFDEEFDYYDSSGSIVFCSAPSAKE